MSLWNRLLRLVGRSKPQQAPALTLEHAALGTLSGTADEMEGRIWFETRQVSLVVCSDGQSMQKALDLAQRVASNLSNLNRTALSLIATDSLASYNEGWRMGEVAQPDGTTKPFENPPLTVEAFLTHFRLVNIYCTGTDLVELWYSCGELFWGHEFSVTAFDGVNFEEAHVAMQG